MNGERRVTEETTLLDVVATEHWEVRDREFEVSKSGFVVWKDSGVGDQS